MPLFDLLAAFRWWAVLLLLGTVTFPLTRSLFRVLPDKGYAFTKMVGLLCITFIFWLLTSLGFLRNDLGGILLAFLSLVGIASLVYLKDIRDDASTEKLSTWIRNNWRHVLIIEFIFLAIFAAWVAIRAQNPAIVATEKPMDFAFLNASSRSPSMPPIDPWLSGFAISYYYFGYLMTSVIARLAAVPEALAFNLGIAWLVAGTALGAFGVIYNLIRADVSRRFRHAILAGLVAAIAIPMAGNLEIILEIGYANGIGGESLWSWLDVRDLNAKSSINEVPRYRTSQWWWWRSSRVIHEYHLSGRAEEGLEPIAEFPSFSFILGDLHPHVLSLPFSFLALAVAQTWWMLSDHPSFDLRTLFQKKGLRKQLKTWPAGGSLLFIFTALLLGAISFLNTWDVLIYLFLILGAFVLARWRDAGEFRTQAFNQAIPTTIGLILMAVIFYLPFYLGFRSQAGAPFLLPMSMMPTRLVHYLIIFGMPLVAITILLGTLIYLNLKNSTKDSRISSLKAGAGAAFGLIIGLFLLMLLLGWLIAMSPEGSIRVSQLLNELGLAAELPENANQSGLLLTWATAAIMELAPKFLQARLAGPFLILFLSLSFGIVIYLLTWFFQSSGKETEANNGSPLRSIRSGSLPFVLLLVGTAMLLSIGPEFVYLRDNFGQRLNTIFKFYYQTWVILGVAAIYGLSFLLSRFRKIGQVTIALYGILLLFSLLFPYFSATSRAIEYRGPIESEDRLPATLDGLDYLKQREPDEYDAIMWLRNQVEGSPVIVESTGGQYSPFGRVAASTGLPTILGWAGHEYQWRGNTPEPAIREPIVRTIYGASNWVETEELLNEYDVSYVYFGPMERNTYDPRAAEKFEQNMDVVYENSTVTIYRWQN